VIVPKTKEVPNGFERTESKDLKASLSVADNLSTMARSNAARKLGSAASRYSQYRLTAWVFGSELVGTERGGRSASTSALSVVC
jgi:phage-related tail protein